MLFCWDILLEIHSLLFSQTKCLLQELWCWIKVEGASDFNPLTVMNPDSGRSDELLHTHQHCSFKWRFKTRHMLVVNQWNCKLTGTYTSSIPGCVFREVSKSNRELHPEEKLPWDLRCWTKVNSTLSKHCNILYSTPTHKGINIIQSNYLLNPSKGYMSHKGQLLKKKTQPSYLNRTKG